MQDTAGEAGTSSLVMFSYGLLHMAEQKQGDQLKPTYSSSVKTRDVAPRSCQKRWTIGRSGERGPGISMLAARDDNDDDDTVKVLLFNTDISIRPKHCGNNNKDEDNRQKTLNDKNHQASSQKFRQHA